MIYATQQPSSFNAFTTLDGRPYLTSFLVFDTQEQFLAKQAEVWNASAGESNLIKQTKSLFEKYIGEDFVIFSDHSVMATGLFLDEKFYGETPLSIPKFRFRNGGKVAWDNKEQGKAKLEVVWYENH